MCAVELNPPNHRCEGGVPRHVHVVFQTNACVALPSLNSCSFSWIGISSGSTCYVDIIIASCVFLETLIKVGFFEFVIEYLCSLEFSVLELLSILLFVSVSHSHVAGFLQMCIYLGLIIHITMRWR